MTKLIDEHMILSGDEDGGVGITCMLCDSGGQPVAYYGWDNAYEKVPEVIYAGRSISTLVSAGAQHLASVHMRQ